VVPKLKGKTLTAARKALGSSHCAVGHLKQPKHKPHGSAPAHKKWALVVTAQSIGAGTAKPAGTKVGLTLVYKLVHA
jgi:hypothetical protein